MTDLVLPLNPVPNEVEWRLMDNSGVNGAGPWGATQTIARPGNRWACRLTYNNLRNADRHRLMAFVASLAGRSNRAWVVDVSASQRGSMSAPELFTNADFSNGVTGWSVIGAAAAANGGARIKATAPLTELDFYQSVTLSNVVPYALRAFYLNGLGSSGSNVTVGPTIDGGLANYSNSIRGYNFCSGVPPNNGPSNNYALVVLNNSTWLAGSYLDLPFASMARCLQVDNGPNALTYSDQIDNAAWTKIALTGVTANAATAPDGTVTADAIVEDSATTGHYVTQSAAGTTVLSRRTVGNTGAGNYGEAYFDLNAGTSSNVGTGGTASNARAFVVPYGSNWYFCCIVARLPSGLTNAPILQLLNGVTASYTGNGTSSVYAWRCGTALSAMPTRGGLTTTTAIASGTSQTGNAIYVKGGPASTNGAFAAGDMVEITEGPNKTTAGYSQMVRLTADLDFDAAGRGYMQFEPSLRVSPADNAAIIVQKPMVKMMLNENSVGWPTRPGLFSDFSVEFVEALT
jgi:hypothetical protein